MTFLDRHNFDPETPEGKLGPPKKTAGLDKTQRKLWKEMLKQRLQEINQPLNDEELEAMAEQLHI